MIWKYLLAWNPMVFLAIANGALREFTYGKRVTTLRAHQISTAATLVLFAVYLGFVFRRWPAHSAAQAGDRHAVSWAHAIGLVVHRYTFRAEALPTGVSSMEQLLDLFICKAQIDGLFIDLSDEAVRFLARVSSD